MDVYNAISIRPGHVGVVTSLVGDDVLGGLNASNSPNGFLVGPGMKGILPEVLDPGTYYLTGGWLEAGSDPLKEYEKYVEKYGQQTADFVMDEQYKNYKRIALVGHSEEDLAEYRERAMQVADYCGRWGMTYHEIGGSDSYVRRLVSVATDLSQADDAFLVIPPGGKIEGWQ